ncbi:polyprotein [Plakobranchus ocellatus]|uniref:Polyprotein n=1 Tax=Plakobranchus ocellatus TaxID=259542 RepID=A0AAV4AGI5_9GAST|nr:polyprotein [Plakobranchus ocellatus]
MYCRKAKLKLPMKSILEEYKCGKVRLLTMLEASDDPVVKTVQPSLKTGRKWKVTEAVDEAKECLKIKLKQTAGALDQPQPNGGQKQKARKKGA